MVLISQNIPAQHKENIFDQPQMVEEVEYESEEKLCTPGMPGCPSGGEDVPADEHVPLLFLIAVALVIFSIPRTKYSIR